MRKIDSNYLFGMRFGKWTVLNKEKRTKKYAYVLCRCSCGAEKFLIRESLVAGLSTGCRKCSGMVASANPAWKGTKDIPANFFYIMRKSASARNIPFKITIDDVQDLWDRSGGTCSLSGLPIKLGSKKLGWSASVDRIDQSKPYVQDNIQFVHKHVNIMKNRFSEDWFFDVCKRVVEHRRL